MVVAAHSEISQIFYSFSRFFFSHVKKETQYAQKNLNVIENNFNGTFAGLESTQPLVHALSLCECPVESSFIFI